MQAANEPAEIHLILNEVDTAPGLRAARAVSGHQEYAGDQLDAEDKSQATPPDITPARPAGDILEQRCGHKLAYADAMIQPIQDRHDHGRPFLLRNTREQ